MQVTIIYATSFIELCVIMGFYGLLDGLFLTFIVPICCEITNSIAMSNQACGLMFCIIALPVKKKKKL